MFQGARPQWSGFFVGQPQDEVQEECTPVEAPATAAPLLLFYEKN